MYDQTVAGYDTDARTSAYRRRRRLRDRTNKMQMIKWDGWISTATKTHAYGYNKHCVVFAISVEIDSCKLVAWLTQASLWLLSCCYLQKMPLQSTISMACHYHIPSLHTRWWWPWHIVRRDRTNSQNRLHSRRIERWNEGWKTATWQARRKNNAAE